MKTKKEFKTTDLNIRTFSPPHKRQTYALTNHIQHKHTQTHKLHTPRSYNNRNIV